MITDVERAWLVGLLEGEGSFGYIKGTQVVALRMADEDVVLRYVAIIEKLVGSRPHMGVTEYGGNRSDIFYVMITGERARIIMRTIVKDMGQRRKAKIWQSLNKYNTPKKDLSALISILPERMVA